MTQKSMTNTLDETIAALQIKQANELDLLKSQFQTTYESLSPVNLIKESISEVSRSPEIKNGITNNAIGLAAGYLSKILLFGSSRNPLIKVMGTLFQYVVTNVAVKHGDNIKAAGENILIRFLQKRKKTEKDFYSNDFNLFI